MLDVDLSRCWSAVAVKGAPGAVGRKKTSVLLQELAESNEVVGGVNADFPITARYGVVMEATYHFVRGEFNQRFLTAGLGLRVGF